LRFLVNFSFGFDPGARNSPGRMFVFGALFCALLPLVFSSGVLAQSVSSAKIFSAALERAVSGYPQVLVLQADAVAAGHENLAARWGRFPSLSASARREDHSSDLFERLVRLEQILWAGGSIQGRIDASKARQMGAEFGLATAQQIVIQQVGNLFFDYMRVQYQLVAAQQNISEHERLVALIERRVATEFSPLSDLVLARSRLQLAISEKLQLRRQQKSIAFSLEQFIGVPFESLLANSAQDLTRIVVELSDLQALERRVSGAEVSHEALDRARRFSPELNQARQQQRLAEADISVVRSQGLPRLSIGYERTWRSEGPLSRNNDVGYLLLQVSPGAGLSAVEAVRAAEARRQAATEALALLERQLQAQLKIVLSEEELLVSELGPLRIQLESSKETMASTLRQYQIGRKGWLDVLNTQREQTQSEFAFANGVFGLHKARLRFLVLVGHLNANQLSWPSP
jgi:adhesin transport system outer membrane protein